MCDSRTTNTAVVSPGEAQAVELVADALEVPDVDEPVAGAAGEVAALGVVGQGVHGGAEVAGQAEQGGGRVLDRPEVDEPLLHAHGQLLAVGGEGERPDLLTLGLAGRQGEPRADGPVDGLDQGDVPLLV